MNRISINKQAADIISVIAGTFLLCVSVEMFILPYHILSGGLAGISVALYPFFHINQTLVINIMDILLLGLGTVFLGKYFFLTTALSALLYPVFNYILEGIIIAPEVDPLLASLKEELDNADLNNMTPLQAFDLLRSMKEQLGI